MLFMIVGTGRCGSTLLGKMLNTHPDLFVINESHWIPKMIEFFGTGTGPTRDLADIVLRTWHVTDQLVYPGDAAVLHELLDSSTEMHVSEFCDLLMSTLASEAGKRLWADKTPDYGPYMAMLQMIWPNLRFVHLIRDGAAVSESMAQHPGYRWMASARETWWTPASFNRYFNSVPIEAVPDSDFQLLWERRLRRIRDEAARLEQGTYSEFRFEDLVKQPMHELAAICRFVGLSTTDHWLASASSLIESDKPREAWPGWARPPMAVSAARLMNELGYQSAVTEA